MELDATETGKAVKLILDQIVRELPGYRWESICAYSDGQGKTILELSLYRDSGQELAVSIAYQVETGDLVHYRYKEQTGPEPESLIDLLLDVLHTEYQRRPLR